MSGALTSDSVQNYLQPVSDTASKRTQRIAELIKQELGRMLVDELKDPRIGFATVTEVRVTGDLRQARIYISVYGPKEQRAASLAGLTAAAGWVKRELGRRLQLRYTPNLFFCPDETLDKAMRMEELMSAIKSGETEVPKPQVSEVLPVDTARSQLAEIARDFEAAEAAKRLALAAKSGKGRRAGSRRKR
jgi:ribosome-binding factor A